MNKKNIKIVISCGGTGGHIFGLKIAKSLKKLIEYWIFYL